MDWRRANHVVLVLFFFFPQTCYFASVMLITNWFEASWRPPGWPGNSTGPLCIPVSPTWLSLSHPLLSVGWMCFLNTGCWRQIFSAVVWSGLSGFISLGFYQRSNFTGWWWRNNKYDCVFVLLITLNCKSLLHVVNFKKNKLFNKIHSPLSHTRLICHKQMRCWIYFEANQITVTLVFCRSPKINRNRNNKKCQQWQMMATR